MRPVIHLILGVIFAIILLVLFPQISYIGFLLIILSSVLIDIDHYIYYVYRKKDYSLKNAYNWFIKNEKKFFSFSRKQRNNMYTLFAILHGIEFLIILFAGIFISKYFLFIFAGVAFHLLLDIVYQTTFSERIDRFSIIYDFFKFKKLKFIEDY